MADSNESSATPTSLNEGGSAAQLEYPQLLIETSLESLLSHSHTYTSRTVARMPQSETSLGESWSSLSEHYFSHDDDLHSEVTDTGSLIDVSTSGDVHSVNDDGDSSEPEETKDNNEEVQNSHYNAFERESICSDSDLKEKYHHEHITGIRPQECIKLNQSTVIVSADGSPSMIGSITMSMSSDNLKLGQHPYRILYYCSTLCSPGIKSEVLGKIGAALITSRDAHTSEHNPESPCYHVVPSEFGPGSNPSTADLIPIPTQMHVSDCTTVEVLSGAVGTSKIHLQLNTGESLMSRPASLFENHSTKQWIQPDLMVIVVSQNDSQDDRSKANALVDFARRHQLAIVCLRQEAGWMSDDYLVNSSSDMLHRTVRPATSGLEHQNGERMLMDVNTFLALDTEQLNLHISHIMLCNKSSSNQYIDFEKTLFVLLQDAFIGFRSQLPTRLAELLGHSYTSAKSSANWVIESEKDQAVKTKQEKRYSALPWASKDRAFVLTAFYRVVMPILLTVLTMVVLSAFVYAGQSIYPMSTSMYWGPRRIEATPDWMIPCLARSTSTTGPSPVTTPTSKHTNALSGPFHALEQQVQSWIPLKKKGQAEKVAIKIPDARQVVDPNSELESCRDIVPAQISPNLKVDHTFFVSGEPNFGVVVRRGDDRVIAKIDKLSDGVATIMVRRKDYWGHLTIHLEGSDHRICASVDLQDSIGEALTFWIKSLRSQKAGLDGAKRFSNEYTRLLDVRTTKSGFVNSAIELQYSAAGRFGAAVEAVEKTTVKHVKVCRNNREECFTNRLGFNPDNIIKSAHLVRQRSQEMLKTTREQILDTSKQARNRANEVREHAREEISKAVQVVQSSLWSNIVTDTLADAQLRAHELVRKPRSRRTMDQ